MGKTAKVVGGVRVMQFLSEEHDDGTYYGDCFSEIFYLRSLYTFFPFNCITKNAIRITSAIS